jgi:nicotinate-nucleotide pyrophosphorylase (carboxylating)
MSQYLDRVALRRLWEVAIAEDGADRDITSEVAIEATAQGVARVTAKAAGVMAGGAVFDLLREAYPALTLEANIADGGSFAKGHILCAIQGPLRQLLGIERTLLNFLQRLCGVATLTRRYVEAVEGTQARIYDTRKTIPGWRQLDKYAVRCGGGHNHRMGLHDAILIKDNHIAGVPTPRLAAHVFSLLNTAASLMPPPHFVEVEVDTLDQLAEVLKVVGVDVILLDNFTPAQMRTAVDLRAAAGVAGKVQFEASGGVQLEALRAIAETGVERIAVGAITHSAPALDINMEIDPVRAG